MNVVVVLLLSLTLLTHARSTQGRPSSDTYVNNYASNELDEDNILKNGANRMAKFLFGGRLGFPASSSSSSVAEAKNFALDVNAVSEGVLKPDNIAIHVAQNAVNFFSSTLAWLVIASLSSASGFSGRSSSSSSYSPASQYNYNNNHGKSLSSDYNAADFIKSFADNYQTEESNTLSKRHSYAYDGGSTSNSRGNDNVYAIRKILRKVVNSSANRN